MVQITQKELERRYVTLTCLQKRQPKPKNPKNLIKWVKAGKLQYAKNYPYEEIINPYLNSMEFWTSNNSIPVESGTYRRIGEFEVVLNSSELSHVSPTWKQILQQCPAKYAVEGIGLCLLHHTKEVDGENRKKTWTVWVMRKTIQLSKEWLQTIDTSSLHDLCIEMQHKGFHLEIRHIIFQENPDEYIQVPQVFSKVFHRITREFFKRQDNHGLEYNAFLSRSTVLKKIRTLRLEKKDVKELVALADIMKSHPERFWVLHNID